MRHRCLFLAALLAGVLFAAPAQPCSRVVWNDNGKAVVVGRSMDWIEPQPTHLYFFPRGVKRDGMTGKSTLKWTAKYGTVLTVVFGAKDAEIAGAADGMNEKGMAGSMLWLAESDYGKYDPGRPSLSLGLWLQYYLDNFATVKEAVEFTEKSQLQLVGGTFENRKFTVHLALTDPTGDTAVIEYIGGKPKVYHGKEHTVMTNSPPYDKQLGQLKNYKGFGGEKALPGTNEAADRFVRGAYYLKALPKPKDYRECIAGVLSVVRNVSAPFGAADPGRPNVSATRWRTVADLTNKVYYFESTLSPNLIWVKLDDLDFAEGASVRRLDLVKNPDRIGDCSKQFEKCDPFVLGPPDLK